MRADFLTNVASIDAFGFSDFFGEVGRDAAFVFDREVGDTQAGVDDAGGDYGAGGAGVDAFGAVAADFGGVFVVYVPAVMLWHAVE